MVLASLALHHHRHQHRPTTDLIHHLSRSHLVLPALPSLCHKKLLLRRSAARHLFNRHPRHPLHCPRRHWAPQGVCLHPRRIRHTRLLWARRGVLLLFNLRILPQNSGSVTSSLQEVGLYRPRLGPWAYSMLLRRQLRLSVHHHLVRLRRGRRGGLGRRVNNLLFLFLL